MATAKDFFLSDLDVFLDADEFAEKHEVNGRMLMVLLDKNEYAVEKEDHHEGVYRDGIFRADLTMHVKMTDLATRPAVGSRMSIDGRLHSVISCVDEEGIYIILLEAQRQ